MKIPAGALAELRRYPSALAGVGIILVLFALAGIALVAIPYRRALDLWRGGEHWREYPVNARPVMVDWLRRERMSRTLVADSRSGTGESLSLAGLRHRRFFLEIPYRYDRFPSEITLFLAPSFEEEAPFARLSWHAPDGREIPLGSREVSRDESLLLGFDRNLERRLGTEPRVGLLAEPGNPDSPAVLKGTHRLEVEALFFEEGSTLEARLVVYGEVHGAAGTDHLRRDLVLPLLWGVPVALAFGLIAAVGTTLATLLIAAAGVWFGGWVDAAIQRLTELNMILPVLPILVMVGTLYTTSLWVMLSVVVILGVFSAGIKMYRAMLLPARNAPFVEAARVYGAGPGRIITRYLVPRVLPVLIPGFVTLIPSFVFLEASLALLGLGDPTLPTWGKVLNDAQSQSALYNGYYYWMLAPAFMLMFSGLGFAMLGFALDRVFNPRLRRM